MFIFSFSFAFSLAMQHQVRYTLFFTISTYLALWLGDTFLKAPYFTERLEKYYSFFGERSKSLFF